MAKRFWKDRKFTDIQCHEDRLEQPFHWRKPGMVFVNSMSDLFHENVPFEFIFEVFRIMAECKRNKSGHVFQILTKRPARMLEFMLEVMTIAYYNNWTYTELGGEPLENVWLGVSVEDQAMADERIPILLQTPAAVRWVSYEPALGEVDLTSDIIMHSIRYKTVGENPYFYPKGKYSFHGFPILDWVVCGGESGHGARPMHPDWARKVRDDCVSAGVPFFFKQWGEWATFDDMPVEYQGILLHKDLKANWKIKNFEFENDDRIFTFHKLGKKKAGRLLDEREWSEYPGNLSNSSD